MFSLANACKGQQFNEPTLWGPYVEGFLGPKKNRVSHQIPGNCTDQESSRLWQF